MHHGQVVVNLQKFLIHSLIKIFSDLLTQTSNLRNNMRVKLDTDGQWMKADPC